MIIPVVPQPPSPRAQELGRRLRETIDTFRRDNPGITGPEIQQAMQLATQGLTQVGARLLVALAVGLVALGLVAFLFLGRQAPLGGQTMILTSIVILGILLIALVFVMKNRQG
jgi:hypothetical protein